MVATFLADRVPGQPVQMLHPALLPAANGADQPVQKVTDSFAASQGTFLFLG